MDTELERPRWRSTVNYKVARILSLGAEINPVVGEVGPLVTLFAFTETETRPAVFFGTSSDRIGSPEGEQSYYMTASKFFHGTPVGAYASLNYSEWDEAFNVPFGISVELGHGFSVRSMYDGQRSHLTAGWFGPRFGVTALYIWYEKIGVSASVGF